MQNDNRKSGDVAESKGQGALAAATGSAIPETVILDMQAKAYERKDAVRKMRNETANQKATADRYQKDTKFAEKQLGEIADFLQLHNADAMKSGVTWRDVLGVPNDRTEARAK